MEEYIIIAGYKDLDGNDVLLGKFKTEEKAWKAIEVEGLRLKRLSPEPRETEIYFEDNCYVIFLNKELI